MLTNLFRRALSTTSLFLLAITFLVSSFATQAALLPKMIEPQEGQTYYTRYNFMFEKGRHVTTNYWRGELVPFNTKVTLVSLGGKKMVLDMDGVQITFVNVQKFTKRGIEKIASELLSPRKISLKGVSGELRDDMEAGIMRLGMTKEQVLMTRGYPPRHKTPSTKANTWRYWSSKFIQRSLVFQKGKLARGRGLY
ncbi:MAG: hypothetical protein ACRBBR_07175 [Cellvibrionaceae bacterium]